MKVVEKRLDELFCGIILLVYSMKKHVQAFICNFTFDNSLEELIETVRYDQFLVEVVLRNSSVEWTVPKWSKKDDVVFFMFAKTAIQKVTSLRSYYNKNKFLYSKKEQLLIEFGIERGIELCKKYGGKIIAIGRIEGSPFYEYYIKSNQHWNGRIYAKISEVFNLENPIDISEFNSFILVSRQSSITAVFGDDYNLLRDLIVSKNKCPFYFLDSESIPFLLKQINSNNWLDLSNEFRRQFFLEKQFRVFYVDYFLKYISDDNKIFMECRCKKNGVCDTFVDNVIKYFDRYLCVEVKLSKDLEKDIYGQLNQYCECDFIELSNRHEKDKKFYNYSVLLIDTFSLYVYYSNNQSLIKIFDLDNLRSERDLDNLKSNLFKFLC